MTLYCRANDGQFTARPQGQEPGDTQCREQPNPPTMTQRVEVRPQGLPVADQHDAQAIANPAVRPVSQSVSASLNDAPPTSGGNQGEIRARFQRTFQQFMRLRSTDPEGARALIPQLLNDARAITPNEQESHASIYLALRDVFRFYRAARLLNPQREEFSQGETALCGALTTLRDSARQSRDAEGTSIDDRRVLSSLSCRISRLIADRADSREDETAWNSFINGIENPQTRRQVLITSLRDSVSRQSRAEMYRDLSSLENSLENSSPLDRIGVYLAVRQIVSHSDWQAAREMRGDGIAGLLGSTSEDSDEVQHWDEQLGNAIATAYDNIQNYTSMQARLDAYALLGRALIPLRVDAGHSGDAISARHYRLTTNVLDSWYQTASMNTISTEANVSALLQLTHVVSSVHRTNDLLDTWRPRMRDLYANLLQNAESDSPNSLRFRALAYHVYQQVTADIPSFGTYLTSSALDPQDLENSLRETVHTLQGQVAQSEDPQQRLGLLVQIANLQGMFAATHSEDTAAYQQSVRRVEAMISDDNIPMSVRLRAIEAAGQLNQRDTASQQHFARLIQGRIGQLIEQARSTESLANRLAILGEAQTIGAQLGTSTQSTDINTLQSSALSAAREQLNSHFDVELASRTIESYLARGDLSDAETVATQLREFATSHAARSYPIAAQGQMLQLSSHFYRQIMLAHGGPSHEGQANLDYLRVSGLFHDTLRQMERMGDSSEQPALASYARFIRAASGEDWDTAQTQLTTLLQSAQQSDDPATRAYAVEAQQVWMVHQQMAQLQQSHQSQQDASQRTQPTLGWLYGLINNYYDERLQVAEDDSSARYPIRHERDQMRQHLARIASYIESGQATSTRQALDLLGQEDETASRALRSAFSRMFDGGQLVFDLIDTETIQDPERRAIRRQEIAQLMQSDSHDPARPQTIGGTFSWIFRGGFVESYGDQAATAISQFNLNQGAEVIGYNHRSPSQALARVFSGDGTRTDVNYLWHSMLGNETVYEQAQSTIDSSVTSSVVRQSVDQFFSWEGMAVLVASCLTAGMAGGFAYGATLARFGYTVRTAHLASTSIRLAAATARVVAATSVASVSSPLTLNGVRLARGQQLLTQDEFNMNLLSGALFGFGASGGSAAARMLLGESFLIGFVGASIATPVIGELAINFGLMPDDGLHFGARCLQHLLDNLFEETGQGLGVGAARGLRTAHRRRSHQATPATVETRPSLWHQLRNIGRQAAFAPLGLVLGVGGIGGFIPPSRGRRSGTGIPHVPAGETRYVSFDSGEPRWRSEPPTNGGGQNWYRLSRSADGQRIRLEIGEQPIRVNMRGRDMNVHNMTLNAGGEGQAQALVIRGRDGSLHRIEADVNVSARNIAMRASAEALARHSYPDNPQEQAQSVRRLLQRWERINRNNGPDGWRSDATEMAVRVGLRTPQGAGAEGTPLHLNQLENGQSTSFVFNAQGQLRPGHAGEGHQIRRLSDGSLELTARTGTLELTYLDSSHDGQYIEHRLAPGETIRIGGASNPSAVSLRSPNGRYHTLWGTPSVSLDFNGVHAQDHDGFTIGRSTDSDIIIGEQDVSRQHARLRINDVTVDGQAQRHLTVESIVPAEGASTRQLGHGVWINENGQWRRLSAGERYNLSAGSNDAFFIGTIRFTGRDHTPDLSQGYRVRFMENPDGTFSFTSADTTLAPTQRPAVEAQPIIVITDPTTVVEHRSEAGTNPGTPTALGHTTAPRPQPIRTWRPNPEVLAASQRLFGTYTLERLTALRDFTQTEMCRQIMGESGAQQLAGQLEFFMGERRGLSDQVNDHRMGSGDIAALNAGEPNLLNDLTTYREALDRAVRPLRQAIAEQTRVAETPLISTIGQWSQQQGQAYDRTRIGYRTTFTTPGDLAHSIGSGTTRPTVSELHITVPPEARQSAQTTILNRMRADGIHVVEQSGGGRYRLQLPDSSFDVMLHFSDGTSQAQQSAQRLAPFSEGQRNTINDWLQQQSFSEHGLHLERLSDAQIGDLATHLRREGWSWDQVDALGRTESGQSMRFRQLRESIDRSLNLTDWVAERRRELVGRILQRTQQEHSLNFGTDQGRVLEQRLRSSLEQQVLTDSNIWFLDTNILERRGMTHVSSEL